MTEGFEEVEENGQRFVLVPPNAGRTVKGLSRLSYAFEEAIADLIDNSIAASATRVEVSIEPQVGSKVYVHVLDDGHGIEKDDLPRAIQYGAEDREDDSSLGVYGFGLKTASQSFTDCFYVVSRGKSSESYNRIVFDENVILKHNQFIYQVDEAPKKYSNLMEKFAFDRTATLIVTENADRFFDSDSAIKDEKKTQKFIEKKIQKTRDHLRKVFQRFLDEQDERVRNVQIYVNDELLKPWDPFCLKEGLVPDALDAFEDLTTKSGKVGNVILRGYILPADEDFNDKALLRDADIGPNTHGVYVYRENRLIQMATYFDLFKRETHLSRLRVELSYDGALDELFKTALSKDSVGMGDLEEAVHDFLKPLVREADARSRGARRKLDTKGIHDTSQKKIDAAESRITKADIVAIDSKTARVHGRYGLVELPIPSRTDGEKALPIDPVEGIDDGVLWQIELHNNRQAVQLNKGHEFYSKVYLPNKNNSIAVQGLDMIFWALAITEANCTIPEYRKQFREFRYEVSKRTCGFASRTKAE
jgi:hypothetical protein